MSNDYEPPVGPANMSAEELISLLDLLERVRVPTDRRALFAGRTAAWAPLLVDVLLTIGAVSWIVISV